jgi:maleate isomerase
METEIPAMFRARETVEPERFTYRHLKLDGADAVVLSACVQMPSLAAIPVVEEKCGLPVISAAVCTAYQMLQRLGLKPYVPGAGSLLSGKY